MPPHLAPAEPRTQLEKVVKVAVVDTPSWTTAGICLQPPPDPPWGRYDRAVANYVMHVPRPYDTDLVARMRPKLSAADVRSRAAQRPTRSVQVRHGLAADEKGRGGKKKKKKKAGRTCEPVMMCLLPLLPIYTYTYMKCSENERFIEAEEAEFVCLLNICWRPVVPPGRPAVSDGQWPWASRAPPPPPPPVSSHVSIESALRPLPPAPGQRRQRQRRHGRRPGAPKWLGLTLSIKLEDVGTHQALHSYGVDSLIAVELRDWLGKEFAADVPIFEILSRKTVETVGELVAKTSRIEKKA